MVSVSPDDIKRKVVRIVKPIGLIGGMSWESTVAYYRLMNEYVKKKRGGLHSAEIILYSVDFDEIEKYQRDNEWERASDTLIRAAQRVEKAGAALLILCTNTMHKLADQIAASVRIPFLHIADLTAQQIQRNGLHSVGLLGTKYTMEDDFYTSRLEKFGIDVILPNQDDRNLIHRVIYEELCLGKIERESKEQYKRVIRHLVAEGAKGIILGCTEITLLVKQEDAAVPLFDTTAIHAMEAVKFALKEWIRGQMGDRLTVAVRCTIHSR